MKIKYLVSVLEKVFSEKMKMVENTSSRFCTGERILRQNGGWRWLKMRSLVFGLENVFSDKMGLQRVEGCWKYCLFHSMGKYFWLYKQIRPSWLVQVRAKYDPVEANVSYSYSDWADFYSKLYAVWVHFVHILYI